MMQLFQHVRAPLILVDHFENDIHEHLPKPNIKHTYCLLFWWGDLVGWLAHLGWLLVDFWLHWWDA
jgi:hypothetical protein